MSGIATALSATASLAGVLLVGHLGGALAARFGQPKVIGEIATGLLLGPALAAVLGGRVVAALLPHPVLHVLQVAGQVGLALFLVGVGYEIRPGRSGLRASAIGWFIAGAVLPAMVTGGVLALWVLHTGRPELRGPASGGPFVLMLMLALAVTAVPVLARILADRQMLGSRDGRIALAAAVAIDALTWLLLAIVLGLAAAGPGGAVRAAAVLLTGGVACVLLRRLLAGSGPARWCARFPRVAALALGVAALAAGALTERFRLTMVFGAVMVGLAVPRGEPDAADQRAADNRVDGNRAGWDRAVRWVGTAGRWLVPVFFTVTGMTVLAARAGGAVAWAALGVALALAVVGKTAGSYLGARAAGLSRRTGLRLGILMNTRGLTEIVVLQAGYRAGILTAQLFVVLVLTALLATALTGPLLSLTERYPARRAPTVHSGWRWVQVDREAS